MKKDFFFIFFALITAMSLTACSSTSSSSLSTLSFEQDVYVSGGPFKNQALKKGETLNFSGEDVLNISAPGYMSLLLYPSSARQQKMSVSLLSQKDWSKDEIFKQSNLVLSEVLDEISQIQALLWQQNSQQGLQRIEALERKYPQLTYLKFLKSSIYVLQGSLDKARALLNEALLDFPKERSALLLQRNLAGKASGVLR